MKPNLRVKIGSIELKNPVLAASGTFGYGDEYADLIDIEGLGGFVTKAITLLPREGNAPPRTVETPAGMLNSIGLENVGVEAFIAEKLPFLHGLETAVIVNIAGSTVEEYVEVTRRLSECDGIDGFELNISCPNVSKGGLAFGSSPETVSEVVSATRASTRLPLIVKLTPNVTDIAPIARAAEDSGADAISLINTLVGMAVDVQTRRPKLASVTGGLSGPAIKPVALAMVWKATQTVRIPIIGIGGILNTMDALEFLISGASAVQVGTGNFVDPRCTMKIIDGLEHFCEENHIAKISDLVGSLQLSTGGAG
ncbi:MAG TPA: dihydroorotate dehydrogenase [Candidatus Latescibacteria bacterium]|nr:dihydroorotate dehydrogenase [Candidatus Latescibacterota bacterium]